MSSQFRFFNVTGFSLLVKTRDFPDLKINTNQQLFQRLLTTPACGRTARLMDFNKSGLVALSMCSSYAWDQMMVHVQERTHLTHSWRGTWSTSARRVGIVPGACHSSASERSCQHNVPNNTTYLTTQGFGMPNIPANSAS